MNEKQTSTRGAASKAYREHLASIREQIRNIKDLADNHFGNYGNDINWCHVGDLQRIEAAMAEILDVAKGKS